MNTEGKMISDLSYVGNRDYIRGIDLLKFFFKFYGANKNTLILRFSINSPITKNGVWMKRKEKPEKYSAHLNLLNENKNISFWFLENGNKITRKDKDSPSLILNIDTKKTLCGNFEFTETIIRKFFLRCFS